MTEELTPLPAAPTPMPQANLPEEAAPKETLTVQSADLLQGHSEVLIMHGADVYRLRLTRNGKLILHK